MTLFARRNLYVIEFVNGTHHVFDKTHSSTNPDVSGWFIGQHTCTHRFDPDPIEI